MAVFNDSDFITTSSGVKFSSNFLLFNSKMISDAYSEESVIVGVIISNLLSGKEVDEKSLKYIKRLGSIDIGDDGYLSINMNKSKLKFGKFINKINTLEYECNPVRIVTPINLQNIENIVDFYKSWVFINETKKLRFVQYFGDDINNGYNYGNFYKRDHRNMLSNSCMNGRYHLLKLYQQNPDKVSLLALVDEDDKIHGRAFLWQLDNGETFLDRIYTMDNFITVIFQDHAMKNEWIIRKSNDLSFSTVSVCRIDKATKKYKSLGESDSKMEIILNTKDILQFPYMDTFFIKSRWGNVFKSYTKKTMWYYKYQSTSGYSRKVLSILGLRF